jgi:hypothetical protein
MTQSTGCALDDFYVDRSLYGRLMHVAGVPGATVVEQVHWEAVTKTEYQPVTWPTDDAYWCGDAGLRSERKPDYHGNEKCIVAADPDPPAVIEQLALLPTNATNDPTGRQLKLTIRRTGILRLTYDPVCLNSPGALGPPDAWDDLTIDP